MRWRGILRNRLGATLAEAVVAMAIIVTVSITAMGLITRFSTSSAKMVHRNEAVNITEKSMECFKYASEQAEFDTLLKNYANVDYSKQDASTYHIEGVDYTVELRVIYTTNSAMFMAIARDSNNRTIISVPRYEKYY